MKTTVDFAATILTSNIDHLMFCSECETRCKSTTEAQGKRARQKLGSKHAHVK